MNLALIKPYGLIIDSCCNKTGVIMSIFTDKGEDGGGKNELHSNSYEVAKDGK